MDKIISWLLDAEEPWVRRGVLISLLGHDPDDPDVRELHRETMDHPMVRQLIDDVLTWPEPPITNHKQAKHPLHKLGALIEMGLGVTDPAGKELADRFLAHQDECGAFLSRIQIPKAFGGTGQSEWDWMGCDAPLILHGLFAMGVQDGPLERAADHLAGLVRSNGWPCSASIPGMRGPGRKDDPCPYATLVALRALSLSGTHRESDACRVGTEMLLSHWERQAERKLYLFGIGTDFRKAKFPFVWYDLLSVLDVLSRFPWTARDPRFQDMLSILLAKADDDGRFTPESVWMAYKGFDFAQKRQPSPMLTLAVERIRKRVASQRDRSPSR